MVEFLRAVIILQVGLLFVWWLMRYVIRPRYERRCLLESMTAHEKACARVFDALYDDIDTIRIAGRSKHKAKAYHREFVYGEIEFLPFARLLEHTQPQPGEIFYDLGSGTGKSVFAASLLHDFGACHGVELLAGMHDFACQQADRLNDSPTLQQEFPGKFCHCEFHQADFLEHDFSSADIVFINAVCYKGELWQNIVERLDRLRSGARIILTTQTLPPERYQLIEAGMYLMSWGMNSAYVYRKLFPRHSREGGNPGAVR